MTHEFPNRLNFTERQRSNNMIYIKAGTEHYKKNAIDITCMIFKSSDLLRIHQRSKKRQNNLDPAVDRRRWTLGFQK